MKVIKSQSDLRYLSLQSSKIAVCTAAILVRQHFVLLPSIDRLLASQFKIQNLSPLCLFQISDFEREKLHKIPM